MTIDPQPAPPLTCVEQGDPDGVPVVLLHGYTDSWRSFEPILERLPRSIRALAVTQRGHGDNEPCADGYAAEDLANDVVALLDILDVERALIVGHSGGGYTAQRFAVDHPERTLGLVLIGTFLSFRDNPGVDELAEAVAHLGDPVDEGFVREFQESTLHRPVAPEFLDTVVAESRKLSARVWREALQGFLDAKPPTELGTITSPTLILWGDRDGFSDRAEQDALAAAIPGSRLVAYEDTGHAVHWEQPERVAADVLAFVDGIAS